MPAWASSATEARPGGARTLRGRSTSATTRRMSSMSVRPGGVQDVGACILVGLKPSNRVGQVGVPADEVLCPGVQHKLRSGVRCLDGSGDPLDGQTDVVDRRIRTAGEIFDRAAGQTYGSCIPVS